MTKEKPNILEEIKPEDTLRVRVKHVKETGHALYVTVEIIGLEGPVGTFRFNRSPA